MDTWETQQKKVSVQSVAQSQERGGNHGQITHVLSTSTQSARQAWAGHRHKPAQGKAPAHRLLSARHRDLQTYLTEAGPHGLDL